MSRRLEDHLYPAGTKGDPTLQPSVLDSDGATISYTSSKRKTSEITVVDVGDSANSNTGDPLRNAFIKVNNFIEASYWTNETIARDMDYFERRLDSDEEEIQRLKTEFNELFDSEYRKNADWFAYAQQKFDSDSAALQAAKTDLTNTLDSEYRKNADWFAYAQQKFDSDEAMLQYLSQEVDKLINQNDSDEAGLQFLQTQMDRHEQRLDSDEAAIQQLRSEFENNNATIALEIFDSTGTKLKTIYGTSTTP